MMTLKRIAVIAMAVVAAATSPALAGTKYAANLVPKSLVHPPPNPTLSSKSSVKLSDKGTITVALAGVTNAGGALVTTSTVYADSVKTDPLMPILDGSEYVVVVKLAVTAVIGLFPVIEFPLPVDLKEGKGKSKLSAAELFGFLPGGAPRTIEIVGSEVWGPLGLAGAPACQVAISTPIPVLFPPDPACRGGVQIGISGLSVPPVAP